MVFGLPLSDDVWSFFLVDKIIGDGYDASHLKEWEWTWLAQVKALPKEELDMSDPFAPAVHFALRCDEYWIVMRPGEDFPSKPPSVNCSYQKGFSFDWYSFGESGEQPSNLSDIVRLYREYCEVLDSTISQLKLLENSFTTLVDYALHEEDNECFVASLSLKSVEDEAIRIFVDWRNPLDFPRYLSSTNEKRFSDLDCDLWDENDDLYVNIRRIIEGPAQEDELDG